MPQLNQCDSCGSYSALPVDDREIYQEPEDTDYEHLCRDCHEDINVHEPGDLDDAELIAAIMEDSIGYADPHHAKMHVDAYRDGERWVYCERGAAVFPADPEDFEEEERSALTGKPPGDLHKLMESARRRWLGLSGEKRERLLEFAQKWAEAEEAGEISSISLSYPTLSI